MFSSFSVILQGPHLLAALLTSHLQWKVGSAPSSHLPTALCIKCCCWLAFKTLCNMSLGLQWWLSGKKPTCQCRGRGFLPWVGKIPWRRKWPPTPVFLSGKSHGQRSLACCRLWHHKRVRHNWATEQQQYIPSVLAHAHPLWLPGKTSPPIWGLSWAPGRTSVPICPLL